MKQYKRLTIEISGNRKTSNAIDVVRGCKGAEVRSGGCYHSCYAAKMSKIACIDFAKPVINRLNEKKLRNQLKNNKNDWMRIGTNGDPSLAWDTTIRVCELCRQEGKTPVVMTKVWNELDKRRIMQLAATRALIQIGVSALDTEKEIYDRAFFANMYANYYEDGTFVKVMTLPYSDRKLARSQESLVSFAREHTFMELPLRIFKTVPYTDKVDWSKMRHHHSPFSGKPDSSWTAGPLYLPKNFDHKTQCSVKDKYTLCPETTCDKCPNKCGTILL